MQRWLVSIFLLACLIFQGVGVAAQWKTGASDDAHAHGSLHQHGIAHHHHDEGAAEASVVVDDSLASVAHLASDGASSSPALLAVVPLFAVQPVTGSPPLWLQPRPPSPDPRGLQRPPRLFL